MAFFKNKRWFKNLVHLRIMPDLLNHALLNFSFAIWI